MTARATNTARDERARFVFTDDGPTTKRGYVLR
jgi:hypothetical protein